jgi:hypothetical protein
MEAIIKIKVLSLPIFACILSALICIAASGQASAQANIQAQCGSVNGKNKVFDKPKVYACCVRIVTKNPGIGQCEKEVAVFRCAGNKNSKYVSPNGCVMPTL